jgi:ribosomal protein S18 acetylase RimI-like enzyme
MNNYLIKQAALDDVRLMFEWARIENWGLGVDDPMPYHIGDPFGFFMGYLDDEPIASVSAIRYSNQFGFMGLYIVKPEYRGNGYGLAIWKKGMGYLHGCNIALDGVIAQKENYQKLGFKFAYHHIHYSGKFNDAIKKNSSTDFKKSHAIPFNKLIDYCSLYFPDHRAEFLSAWFNMPNSISLVVEKNNKIQGLGCIRKCHGGYTVAPLFANDASIAEDLLLALGKYANGNIFLDVPEINIAAIDMLNRLEFQPVFMAARMYTQQNPQTDLSNVFGVTSMTMG